MNDIEWQPAMWSARLLGTRIKVTDGTNEIVGELTSIASGNHQIVTNYAGTVSLGRPGHWSVFTEVPPVVLPTDDDLYRALDGSLWHLADGKWWGFGADEPYALWEAELLIVLPLTRLRPESEVAAEVLAAVSTALNLRMVPEQGTGRVVLSVGNFTDDLKKMRTKWAKK
jgi:hypothetical protein